MVLKHFLMHCFMFIVTSLGCDRFTRRENVRFSWSQSCDNKTIVTPHVAELICMTDCVDTGCKAVLFTAKQLDSAIWCCLIHSPEVHVANGNGILIYDPSMTVRQCEDELVANCAGKKCLVL